MYRHKHHLKKIAPVYHTHTHLHIDVYEEAIVTFKLTPSLSSYRLPEAAPPPLASPPASPATTLTPLPPAAPAHPAL